MPDPDFSHPPGPIPPAPPPALAMPAPPAAPYITHRARLCDPTVPHDQRTFALLMHVSIVLLHLMLLFSFLVPLIMWLSRRDRSAYINDQGREAVNFHLTIALYALVSLALWGACHIGVPLLIATYVLAIVGAVSGCLAASRAEYYRYPMCVRFIS